MSDKFISGAADLLGGAAKGFLSGGPLGALLGAITGVLPDIGVHLFGESSSTVVAAVQEAASAITGISEPRAADIANLPPEKTAEFRTQLAQIAAQAQKDKDAAATAQMTLALAEMQARLTDTASARTMAASGGGLTKYGSIVVSVLVMGAFATLIIGPVFTGRMLQVDDGLRQVLYAAVMLVLGFWVGSSSGSQGKDAAIAGSIPSGMASSMITRAAARPPGK